jgi:hypothetical protein
VIHVAGGIVSFGAWIDAPPAFVIGAALPIPPLEPMLRVPVQREARVLRGE